jgi:hypothetical protein
MRTPALDRLVALGMCVVLNACVPPQARQHGAVLAWVPGEMQSGPFPSNQFTVADPHQLTGLRINLPTPDCSKRPDDCHDTAILNQLDGFSLRPMLSVPFDGAIAPSSVTSATLYFAALTPDGELADAPPIGIDQVIWSPNAHTLSVRPASTLEEHTTYVAVMTRGMTDSIGRPIVSPGFAAYIASGAATPYQRAVQAVYRVLSARGVSVAALSLFTTESVGADLRNIRAQLAASPIPRADLRIAHVRGKTRVAAFDAAALAQVTLHRQITTQPGFADEPADLAQLQLVPHGTSRVVFGKYPSPQYITTGAVMPAVPSGDGTPVVQRMEDVYFVLFLPAGTPPPGGWPVAIFGHGYSDDTLLGTWGFGSVLPSMGIAVLGINAVGHGGGPASTVTVRMRDATVAQLPGMGRSVDVNGDGKFARYEGIRASGSDALIDLRDGLRQTVIDLMQLTRVVQGGISLTPGGAPLVDRKRIYYVGASMGGVYGTQFVAMEPSIRAAALIATGGPWSDIVREGALSKRADSSYGETLARRTPSLINLGLPDSTACDDNAQAARVDARVDTVPGAFALRQWFDRLEWAGERANPVAYAAWITRRPWQGSPRPVVVDLVQKDLTMPRAVSDALIEAGGWQASTTLFRFDTLRQQRPDLPADPHRWQTGAVVGIAMYQRATQAAIGEFFLNDGTRVVTPPIDGLYETPAPTMPTYGIGASLTLAPGTTMNNRDKQRYCVPLVMQTTARLNLYPLPYLGAA